MRHIPNVLALLTIIPAGCFSATKYRGQTAKRVYGAKQYLSHTTSRIRR